MGAPKLSRKRLTWTRWTYRCVQCCALCRVSQEQLKVLRSHAASLGANPSDELLVRGSIELCLRCSTGMEYEGERIAEHVPTTFYVCTEGPDGVRPLAPIEGDTFLDGLRKAIHVAQSLHADNEGRSFIIQDDLGIPILTIPDDY